MDDFLDWTSIAAIIGYIAFIAAALIVGWDGTYRKLVTAVRLTWVAAAFAAAALVIDVASVPYDGWAWVILPAITFVMALVIVLFTKQRRDLRKADDAWRVGTR